LACSPAVSPHDFNNILTGITTNLFMARMCAAGNEEACHADQRSGKGGVQGEHADQTAPFLLKRRPSVKETASIKQIIQDTIGFCLSGSNVDYRLEMPDDLDPVEVDKGQIDQVITT